MNIDVDLMTILVVVGFAAIVAYKISYLHNKRLFNLSLLQILYFVVVPGLIYPLFLGYLDSIIRRPLSDQAFIPDKLIRNITMLSCMYLYCGLAIHAVTKTIMLSVKKLDNLIYSEVLNTIKYFHLTFSHNMIYLSMVMVGVMVAILEVNHVPPDDPVSIASGVMKGVLLGVALLAAFYNYHPEHDFYTKTRWKDLQYVFVLVWILMALVIYVLRRMGTSLDEYQLLLPMFVAMSFPGVLGMFLAMRKVKRRWG